MSRNKFSPLVLSIFAAVGVGITAVMAVKAKPKADEAIEEAKKAKKEKGEGELTPVEKVAAAGKYYVPAVVTGTGTVLCIFGANHLNKRQQATLAAAYPLLKKSYDEYKDTVKEVLGIDAHNKVVDAINKEKCESPHLEAPCTFYSATLDVQGMDEPEITRTFYDEISHRYFEATLHDVDQAIYHLNRNHILGKNPTENEWAAFLGMEDTPTGDNYCWVQDWENEIYWIDFEYQFARLDDGMEVIYIKCLSDTIGIDEAAQRDLAA